MVVCGPGTGDDLEEYLEKVEDLVKETGATIPVIFVLNENTDELKRRLMSFGLSEEWILMPQPGQTVRASELLKAIKKAEEETESDPPVFEDSTPKNELDGTQEKNNQVICVSSSKRGCGCDTMATSLAAHAAEAGLKVAYIDLGEPPCASFHFGVPEPAFVQAPAVYETKWGILVVPGDDVESIFEDVVSKHDVTIVSSPNRLIQLEGSKSVVVLDRDIQIVEITSAQIMNMDPPIIFVNRSSENGRPDAACIFGQKGYEVITADTDTNGCIRALADCKPALTRSPQVAQAVGKLASALRILG
ncbi:hypothetical protein L9W92_16590 [Pelotomaculum terephthalicicum JT]|uniref:hypothetical protein n=1 Tax=Pelotomaculum terephthalicicum TaxID=206393 RepID=UPI001F041B6D|nr:hypothetical protein [Pelotomaculum terephthalicicum]MCG9969623.1 hypothetical protein [Pelotomaculum terephthalicicum JT]